MKTLATDSNNDLYLSKGRIVSVSDADAIAQICTNVVRTALGELQYDTSAGVPWFETVFSGGNKIDLWVIDVINALQNVTGVISVKSFDYTVEGENVEYTAIISTIYGSTTINA